MPESDNVTDQSPSISFSKTSSCIIGVLSTFVSIATILGNILVIISFFLERMLRTSTNYFIASLAVTDLLIGVFSMNFYTTYVLLGHWPLGELSCDLWLSLDYTACLTSQYTVFFITVDRFCSVRMPAKYRNWRTDTKVRLMVGVTWIIPFAVFFTTIMGWPYLSKKGRIRRSTECYAEFSSEPIFNTILTIAYFWVTLIVMIVLYSGIYRVALNLQRKSDNKRKRLVHLISSSSNQMSDSNETLTKSYTSHSNINSYKKRPFHYLGVKQRVDTNSSRCIDDEIRYHQLRYLHSDCDSDHNSSMAFLSDSDTSKHSYAITCTEKPTYLQSPKRREIYSPYVDVEHFEERNKDIFSPSILGLKYINTTDMGFLYSASKEVKLDIEKINSSPYCRSQSPLWEKRNYRMRSTTSITENTIIDNSSLNLSIVKNNRTSSIVEPIKFVARRLYNLNNKSNKSQGHNVNRARKALRTITLILGAFVISWTPFHIIVLIKGFCDQPTKSYTCINAHLYNLVYWLCYLNSPINPFCYALANEQFKKTFLRILHCDFRRS